MRARLIVFSDSSYEQTLIRRYYGLIGKGAFRISSPIVL
jgi:hypothetical protein